MKNILIILLLLFIVHSATYSQTDETDKYGGRKIKETGEYQSKSKPKLSNSGKTSTSKVISVIDAYTLRIYYMGNKASVRFIGIDCPESRVNKKSRRDAEKSGKNIETILKMGKRAKEFVESLVKPGDLITIEYDVKQMDRYKRLLGYVYLPNGKMLNEEIVKAGYASALTIPPNEKYQGTFLKAYQDARRDKLGFWK